jgi:hypothetical protein
LIRARAHKAERVFAVTGCDAANIQIAMNLCRNVDNDGPICHIHLTDPFQAQLMAETCHNKKRIQPFNMFQTTARQFVLKYLQTCVPRADQLAHYFLFGFNPIGQALALQAVRQAHFINHKRLRMTIFTEDLNAGRDSFLAGYPAFCPQPGTLDLSNPPSNCDQWEDNQLRPVSAGRVPEEYLDVAVEYTCNAEFEPLPLDVQTAEFTELLETRLGDPQVQGIMFVCLENEQQNFEIAVRLKKLCQRNGFKNVARIFVWIPKLTGLADIVDNAHSPSEDHGTKDNALTEPCVITFGNAKEVCGPDDIIKDKLDGNAIRIHKAHRELVERLEPERKDLPPLWEDLSREHQESNRQQYDHLDIKLQSIGFSRTAALQNEEKSVFEFTDEQVKVLAKMEHNRWMAERLLAGYRYAPAEFRKTSTYLHPDLVPWEKLDENSKQYDCKAVSRLPSLLRETNEKIERITSIQADISDE